MKSQWPEPSRFRRWQSLSIGSASVVQMEGASGSLRHHRQSADQDKVASRGGELTDDRCQIVLAWLVNLLRYGRGTRSLYIAWVGWLLWKELLE